MKHKICTTLSIVIILADIAIKPKVCWKSSYSSTSYSFTPRKRPHIDAYRIKCFQRGSLLAKEDFLWRKIWSNYHHEYYSDRFQKTKSKQSRIFLKSTPFEQIQTHIRTNSGKDLEIYFRCPF